MNYCYQFFCYAWLIITDRLKQNEVKCAEVRQKHELFRKDLPTYSTEEISKHSNA